MSPHAPQTSALAAAGFDVPHTVAVFGKDELVARAAELATLTASEYEKFGKIAREAKITIE